MKKTILVINSALLLMGCTMNAYRYSIKELITIPLHYPLIKSSSMQEPNNNSSALMLPNIKVIDWRSIMLPIVSQLINDIDISNDSILLVNIIQNNTNGDLQTWVATSELINLISSFEPPFKVIDLDKLNIARQTIGLSSDDSLESRNKALWIARHLNAKYVLYSIASGYVKYPKIDMQLMLVKSGEIIWSSNSS